MQGTLRKPGHLYNLQQAIDVRTDARQIPRKNNRYMEEGERIHPNERPYRIGDGITTENGMELGITVGNQNTDEDLQHERSGTGSLAARDP